MRCTPDHQADKDHARHPVEATEPVQEHADAIGPATTATTTASATSCGRIRPIRPARRVVRPVSFAVRRGACLGRRAVRVLAYKVAGEVPSLARERPVVMSIQPIARDQVAVLDGDSAVALAHPDRLAADVGALNGPIGDVPVVVDFLDNPIPTPIRGLPRIPHALKDL